MISIILKLFSFHDSVYHHASICLFDDDIYHHKRMSSYDFIYHHARILFFITMMMSIITKAFLSYDDIYHQDSILFMLISIIIHRLLLSHFVTHHNSILLL